MQPLVSILIPAYNAENWIGETLRSALAQTWPRTEIIVVDDGSKDNTLAAARKFESERLRVVTKQNGGAAAARNHAFSLCQGDYIQWLDADDLLAPDKIERQMAAILKAGDPRLLFCCGWGRFIYRPSQAQFEPTSLWQDRAPADWMVRKMEENLYMQTATWLPSRELTVAAGPWDTRLLGDDDGEYFCRVLLASKGERFVPEARTYYRLAGAESLSYVGNSSRKLEAQYLSCELNIDHLLKVEDSPQVRAACLKYLQRYQVYFYPERMDLFEKSQAVAARLGGRMEIPRLSWKYAWIQKLFGWNAAKRAQVTYNRWKSAARIGLDKFRSRRESDSHA
ncbi:MAG: glycosyltransferase family 2 protein [Verrucomicrobiota bacterium]